MGHLSGVDPMWTDPIVEEVRRARDEQARRFNYDLDAIFDDVRRRQAAARRKKKGRREGDPKGSRSKRGKRQGNSLVPSRWD